MKKQLNKFVVFLEDTLNFKKGEVVRLARLPKRKSGLKVLAINPVLDLEDFLFIFDKNGEEVKIPRKSVILDIDSREWQDTLLKAFERNNKI